MSDDLYSKNLLLYAEQFPKQARMIDAVESIPWHHCKTGEGENNLYRIVEGKKEFFHDEKSAIAEAEKAWEKAFISGSTLFVCLGLGTGQFFSVARTWLSSDTNHRLIFLEHDLSVMHKFLELELAQEMLEHPQVRIIYVTHPRLFENRILQILLSCIDIFGQFSGFSFAAIPYYTRTNSQLVNSIQANFVKIFQKVHQFYLKWKSNNLTKNYFANLFELPHSFQFDQLRGKFNDIPAIICGAGPSLQDNIEQIKELQDKALLFPSGSAINIFATHQIEPHFLLYADPNYITFAKTCQHNFYEVPFFYINRVHRGVFEVLQGPQIHVPTSEVTLDSFIGCELGLPYMEKNFGSSSTTINIAIAEMLGCNPIILLGADFSYTDEKRYATGMVEHPLLGASDKSSSYPYIQLQASQSSMPEKESITTSQFIDEVNWLSKFCHDHPQIELLYSSEKGMEIPCARNLSFDDIRKKYLQKKFDLKEKVHVEVFKAKKVVITEERLIQKIEEVANELALIESLIDRKINIRNQLEEENDLLVEKPLLANFSLITEKLKEIRYYQFYSLEFDNVYNAVIRSQKTIWKQKDHKTSVLDSLSVLTNQKNYFSSWKQMCDQVEMFHTPLQVRRNEAILSSTIDEKDDVKQFFGDDDEVLVKVSVKDTIREGSTTRYYTSGSIYALEFYKDGNYEGDQKYFYEDGTAKSIIPYREGKLHGTVFLYHPDGSPKREQEYRDGIRHGREKVWNRQGTLILDLLYQEGLPKGKGKFFDSQGDLLLEAEFDNDGNLLGKKEYGEF